MFCFVKANQEFCFTDHRGSALLGRIADKMDQWEGPIAENLGLTRADVAAIKVEYEHKLTLQT